uniref:Uncharacterized protein n=1 Tax=Anguilla anguilla TaxID=7936 RepID=A0A0E9R0Q0_ANGAN
MRSRNRSFRGKHMR